MWRNTKKKKSFIMSQYIMNKFIMSLLKKKNM